MTSHAVDPGRQVAPVPASAINGPVSHAIFRMTRLHRLRAAQLLREVGLHPAQELVMMQLWDGGRQRQADLVRQLGSDAATMTRTIQRLESAGYVRRLPCDDDKRVTLVESTDRGAALRSRVDALWAELEADTLRGLSEVERSDFFALLQRTEATLAAAVETVGDPHSQKVMS